MRAFDTPVAPEPKKTGQSVPSRSGLRRLLPALAWLGELRDFNVLRADLVAGLTVALVLIPQSMAYAQLAGLPPYYGLYASFLPPVVGASVRFVTSAGDWPGCSRVFAYCCGFGAARHRRQPRVCRVCNSVGVLGWSFSSSGSAYSALA